MVVQLFVRGVLLVFVVFVHLHAFFEQEQSLKAPPATNLAFNIFQTYMLCKIIISIEVVIFI